MMEGGVLKIKTRAACRLCNIDKLFGEGWVVCRQK